MRASRTRHICGTLQNFCLNQLDTSGGTVSNWTYLDPYANVLELLSLDKADSLQGDARADFTISVSADMKMPVDNPLSTHQLS